MSEATPYLVGLIGTGTTPSLTPPMHMEEGRQQGLGYVYRPIDLTALDIDPARLPEVLDWAERLGFNAVNVTHPCKQAVVPLLDHLDPAAAAIGAVNTVLFTPEGRVGHNTDTTGFERAIRAGLPDADLASVVQLGAGGAGSAVAAALLRLGAGQLTIVDVDAARAEQLAAKLSAQFGREVGAAGTAAIPSLITAATGVVNCTPIGMDHHPGTPFDTALLRAELWVTDIVYRPFETALLRAAQAIGCRTLDGGAMAVAQAVDAFRLVTGVEPDAERMRRHFTRLVDAENVAAVSVEGVESAASTSAHSTAITEASTAASTDTKAAR